MKKRTPSFLLAAALCLAAGSVQAQPAGQGDRQPPAEHQARLQAMREQRARDLRTVLRLRPDQESALQAYLAALEPRPQEAMGEAPRRQDGALSTPERLDEMARHVAEHTGEAQRRLVATRAFYAALGSDQQPVFDALERLQAHHGPHDGRGPMAPRPPEHEAPPPPG